MNKKQEEFNLSEKMTDPADLFCINAIAEEDVKEFIRRLKKEICFRNSVLDYEQEYWVEKKIDKLAGDKFK
jgi:NAD-dependent DNA ligase